MPPGNDNDEVSVSSSNSSGSRLLPRIFHQDIRKYQKENRMIMPFPDSESDMRNSQQREEANLKRLVQMAKHQQSLMTTANEPPRRLRSLSRSVPTDVDDGPVDVDSVQPLGPVDVDSIGEESTTSSAGSSKMRSFLHIIRPLTPSSVSPSEKTMRISNVTDIEHGSETTVRIRNVNDIERGNETALRIGNVNDIEHAISIPEEKSWRPRLVGGSLVCLLVLAIIVVIVSVTLLQQSGDSLKDVEHTFGPTFESSTLPSMAPSPNVPSQQPSMAPSTLPSLTPTLAPTVTLKPSASQFPSSIFSTSIFETQVKLSGVQDNEQYGHTVALSGDGSILAVGAPHYSHDNLMQKCGRVQVFERSGTEWKLKGETLLGRNSLDQFGFAVSLSEDGTRLAVSEPDFDGPEGNGSGNVRVFDFDGEKWSLVGKEIGGGAAVAKFGHSLALAGDGKRLAVGSPYYDSGVLNLSGRVSIFELKEKSWQPVGDALDGEWSLDWFGWSVDVSHDGNVICVGAPRNMEYGGYARCFQWKESAWTQVGSDIINDIGNVQPSDRFAMAVSLSSDGTRVAIGSPWKDLNGGVRKSGRVAVYELTEQLTERDEWRLLGNEFVGLDPNNQLGWSLDLSGDYLSIGILGLNRVSIHRWTGLGWDTVTIPLQSEQQRDDYGYSIAMSSDGKVVVVGATEKSQGGKGYALVLERL